MLAIFFLCVNVNISHLYLTVDVPCATWHGQTTDVESIDVQQVQHTQQRVASKGFLMSLFPIDQELKVYRQNSALPSLCPTFL